VTLKLIHATPELPRQESGPVALAMIFWFAVVSSLYFACGLFVGYIIWGA
jgi:hypothetical protein